MASATHSPALLTNPLAGTGVRLHSASSDGFLTMWLHTASSVGSGPPANNNAVDHRGWVRVNIGSRSHELWLPLQAGVALTNMPIFTGEEVWLATDQVNTHAAVGIVTLA